MNKVQNAIIAKNIKLQLRCDLRNIFLFINDGFVYK